MNMKYPCQIEANSLKNERDNMTLRELNRLFENKGFEIVIVDKEKNEMRCILSATLKETKIGNMIVLEI